MKSLVILLILSLSIPFARGQEIYAVNYASQADVKVYVVKYESQADKKIYYVEYESQADLKIYFVEYESQAGWINNHKKHLLY